MAIPAHLNREQFHNLIHEYTGGLHVRRSAVQKMLKEAGVHKEVMYGARFGREKATKILSTLKGHLETSYKKKGYGLRGRGELFGKDPKHVYHQQVRKLAQEEIARKNEARADTVQRRDDANNAAQRQKLAMQTREQRRAAVQSRLRALQPNVAASASTASGKPKDEMIVPPPAKMLYGEGIAALTGTARPGQENPTFFEEAQRGHGHGELSSQSPQPEVNPLGAIAKEGQGGEETADGLPDTSKDAKLPDTEEVDRGLPL